MKADSSSSSAQHAVYSHEFSSGISFVEQNDCGRRLTRPDKEGSRENRLELLPSVAEASHSYRRALIVPHVTITRLCTKKPRYLSSLSPIQENTTSVKRVLNDKVHHLPLDMAVGEDTRHVQEAARPVDALNQCDATTLERDPNVTGIE
ncbi:hypothetical protein COCC4DRAFT_62946 [Bipolaris maydis ATCC 48331]|uniref:Uncharacterized protein n=2 Tax=Cochliobolus heterostrophus TaxID=5016 RepID=M2TY78_COCH5|nr:uncharacterized protein COCC4DRAFT_62946 [Bipolaris maydis ATCC 48331]EMD86746.1 hypothetical protein COCHEDRAFT_1034512 [Bipolaris maydis C5]ENI03138.1 hypothetical protein COCC4DRAFT_62946 [Bipolaris maydis ATCC 48331]KAJ6192217.1 hypothetical protein J3E72DRAFT_273572 [Bipolaris maydis]